MGRFSNLWDERPAKVPKTLINNNTKPVSAPEQTEAESGVFRCGAFSTLLSAKKTFLTVILLEQTSGNVDSIVPQVFL